jgi:hypothetical protein
MGHAGAIISGGSGTAAEKMQAFEAAGVPVARIPSEIPDLIGEALSRRRARVRRAQKRATSSRRKPAGRTNSTRGRKKSAPKKK